MNFQKLIAVLVVACGISVTASAQKPTTISAADKKAIQEIFKGVDAKSYRLQFNDGKEVMGARKVEMKEIQQVKKIRTPGGESASVVLVSKDEGVMYVFASTKAKLTSVLGAEKVKQLNAIMAKYQQ